MGRQAVGLLAIDGPRCTPRRLLMSGREAALPSSTTSMPITPFLNFMSSILTWPQQLGHGRLWVRISNVLAAPHKTVLQIMEATDVAGSGDSVAGIRTVLSLFLPS